MLTAQTEIAREGIATECYGFDPFYNAGFEDKGFTMSEGLSVLADVARSSGSSFFGLSRTP